MADVIGLSRLGREIDRSPAGAMAGHPGALYGRN